MLKESNLFLNLRFPFIFINLSYINFVFQLFEINGKYPLNYLYSLQKIRSLQSFPTAKNYVFTKSDLTENQRINKFQRLCKNKIFSQSIRRTQRKSILSVNSVLSVRNIFFAFTQSLKLLSLFFFSTTIIIFL